MAAYYGVARAAEFGHTRFDKAKCYPGFYPQWAAQYPVKLIGHSMGGPTRLLVKWLEDASPANADGDTLFRGGRAGWVKNVMNISSPNSGSPAADNVQVFFPTLPQLLIKVAGALGSNGEFAFCNFTLGHYGLVRQPGESLTSYSTRVMNSPIMTSHDLAGWDLRLAGAKELNDFVGRSAVTTLRRAAQRAVPPVRPRSPVTGTFWERSKATPGYRGQLDVKKRQGFLPSSGGVDQQSVTLGLSYPGRAGQRQGRVLRVAFVHLQAARSSA